jgi:hypothetical protein
MSRLYTFSRFAEPDDEKPVCTCDYCDADLYEGETVYKINGEVYCSTQCVADAYCTEEIL